MRKRIKKFFVYVGAQCLTYIVLVYNIRMIALGNKPWAMVTDAGYALAMFLFIRGISHEENKIVCAAGYIAGSVLGTWIGMSI